MQSWKNFVNAQPDHEGVSVTESKVEVKGFEARHYDLLMNVITLGKYPSFIRNAISKMDIQPDDHILDMGCGTGRNSCLMRTYLSDNGKITGLDIGDEMIAQFKRKCQPYSNVELKKLRIDKPLPFDNEYDKVFLSFVFHGFENAAKRNIIDNAKKALKPGGQLIILDWNEFQLAEKPRWFQWLFRKVECPLAWSYIQTDWKATLSNWNFYNFTEHFFIRNLIRVLIAEVNVRGGV